ncbi:hypothetical protein ASQ66_gp03 [Aeropyrum pernix spindle-shaped virus 1]|uniref:Uncharacterized protein n=1 Tax=Aeropyrum pernix (strain ATCC 700893 / DSM 11879 / JCM 9820 / NBRC 100138 / K1) TaxID=272557 RepID=Q9YDU7_AERPE|nr:hypothetical protein [Aeropyrum pernix]YP_009177733.1 hypothetical protein ASQ66_gp03 [Aeropyrum pernix spindle-shaped virus 1]BAA79800.1 hypothetical protein APE_0821 [Aeropyrum pernix spindle-shaped virus 1] [Aeropyrum pernix K1]CCD22091.1 TPA: hypothetical protein [Aeropyrum pernix spindle-shaped virus 1]
MAVPPASRACRGGGGRGWGLEIVLADLRRGFSNLLEWELLSIVELKRRGLGLSEIAKAVYGTSRKRYRVFRILRRLQRMGVLDCLLEGSCCALGGEGDGGHVAPAEDAQHEGDDGSGEATSEATWEGLPGRLGRTQKLVIAALAIQLEATPSMIAAYVNHAYGKRVSRNAVWHALKRLSARGVVERLPRGYYRLRRLSSGILVENLRVRGRMVWSTREEGRPATLEEALITAALRDRTWPVEQAELLSHGPRKLLEKARLLERLGWRMTVMYIDRKNGAPRLKLEHRLWNTPIPARPEELYSWVNLYREASSLARDLAEHILARTR